MNYGYHDENELIDLGSEHETNRYPIQLYHRLAKKVDIKSKKIVEVGCGRGGGLAYINKTFSPGYALGVDLNSKATQFSNKHFKGHTLSYMQGDAQNLNLADEDFDILLNVESSHRYPKVEKFFDEVYRILKPGGYFLYTDFRERSQMDVLQNQLSKYNYRIIEEQIINENVGKALKLDSDRREDLIKRKIPFFLRSAIRDFSGNEGSPTYNNIVSGDLVYFVFYLQKTQA